MDQDIVSSLIQLQGQLPDFWSKQLEESTAVQTLIAGYSYVYGAALQKWQMIQNQLTPFTTDAYEVNFYKVINVRQTVTPSDPALNGNGNFYYKLPTGTFQIDSLSRDLTFTNNIEFNILYDKVLKQTLLEISALSLTYLDNFLYIRQYNVDNGNMVNTWGALFLAIQPYKNSVFVIYDSETQYSQYINAIQYELYLQNIKAQIINFIKCATMGSTVDALESLISVAMNKPYALSDGIVIDFTDHSTFIDCNGTIIELPIAPKAKFQIRNTPILAYEAPGECPVKFYSWSTNPARFTQALLCQYSDKLYTLLDLADGELPTSLRYDMPGVAFDPSANFGISRKPLDAYTSDPDYNTTQFNEVHDFTTWTNPSLSSTVYQLFKNVIICEIASSDINININEQWINNVLEYFRPLNCKYLNIVS